MFDDRAAYQRWVRNQYTGQIGIVCQRYRKGVPTLSVVPSDDPTRTVAWYIYHLEFIYPNGR